MAGSTFGTLFRITTWGESHGAGIGVVVDGCPAGLPLAEEDIQVFLDRRRPGQNRFTTARHEADRVRILSGVFEGKTTGTPISLMVENTDQRSKDYANIKDTYRPGHADFCYDEKYGFRDYRGGGRSSARETIGRVAAGAIAAKLLSMLGIRVTAFVSAIGPVQCDPRTYSASETDAPSNLHENSPCIPDPARILESPLYMPDPEAEMKAAAYLEECIKKQDSAGSVVTCHVTGLMSGIGEPVFDKLDAELGRALFSIGAVKAVEIGDGTAVSKSTGSQNNDTYRPESPETAPSPHKKMETKDRPLSPSSPAKASNHAGGIYGGISDGSMLILKAHFKPTPSIAQSQSALTADGDVRELVISGRHDPVIGPRAVVVVESMVAITLLDLILRGMTATVDDILRFRT